MEAQNFIIDEEKALEVLEDGTSMDLLNTKVYAEALAKSIECIPENKSFTIGLYGDWGTGKSSVIKTLEKKYEASSDKKYKFVTYDAWKYANDSFRRMFLFELQEQLEVKRTKRMERFYDNINEEIEVRHKGNPNYVKAIILAVMVIALIVLVLPKNSLSWSLGYTTITSIITLFIIYLKHSTDDLKVTCQKSRLFAPEQFEECFDEIVEASLKESDLARLLKWIKKDNSPRYDKLIIVVDNLDRCSAQQAQETLTTVKSFLGKHSNVVFIIPLAVNSLKHHLVKSSCGEDNENEANEYLRKFFNVSIWIKPFQNDEMFDFTQHLNNEYHLHLSKPSISNISREYATNPRRIIQLLNNLIVEFSLYDIEFVDTNEAAICVMAIIREEFQAFYAKLVTNPYLLFRPLTDEDKKENPRLELFLARTKATMIPYKDTIGILDKIISNSAVFKSLPKEVSEALETYKVETISEFIGDNEDRKNLVLDCLKDKVCKVLSRDLANTELPSLLRTIISLDSLGYLDEADYKAIIDLLNEDIKWENQIEFLEANDFHSVIDFASKLRDASFGTMFREIVKYYLNSTADNNSYSDNEVDNIGYVASKAKANDYDNNLIECFQSAYEDNPFVLFKYKYQKPSLLFDKKLVDDIVANLSYENMQEKNGSQEQLVEITKQIDEKSDVIFQSYIIQVLSFTPSYSLNPANANEILEIIGHITDYFRALPNLEIKDTSALQELCNTISNIVTIQVRYSTEKHDLYSDISSSKANLSILYDFLKNSTIKSKKLFVPNKMLETLIISEEMKEATMTAFKDFVVQGIDISNYAVELVKYNLYDEDYLKVLENLLSLDAEGEFRISSEIVDDEINEILDFLSNNTDQKVEACAVRLAAVPQIQTVMVEKLKSKSVDYLVKMPNQFRAMIVEKFAEQLGLFENNIGVLELIASHGSKASIMELVKVITKKMMTSGQELNAVSLIGKLHYCNKKNYNQLVSCITNIPDDVISEEDKKCCFEHLDEIVPKK